MISSKQPTNNTISKKTKVLEQKRKQKEKERAKLVAKQEKEKAKILERERIKKEKREARLLAKKEKEKAKKREKILERKLKKKEKERAKLREYKRLKKEKENAKLLAKKEKQKEKEKARKILHVKKLRKKNNKRYYAKRRKKELAEREANGDVHVFHKIILTKNKQKIKLMAKSRWKSNAIKRFQEIIDRNSEDVVYPVKVVENKKTGEFLPVDYEILLLQKNEGGDNVTKFRNENGQFVENVIIDSEDFLILNKHVWYIEETFNVFGYHPTKDRKTFSFILEEMILKDVCRENIKRIYTHQNKLVIQYDTDFDYVTCKNIDEAKRLYEALAKKVGKNKYIFFTQTLNRNLASWFLNKLVEKTGRSRMTCIKTTTK